MTRVWLKKQTGTPVQNPFEKHNFSPFLATQTMMLNKRKIDAKGNKRRKKT